MFQYAKQSEMKEMLGDLADGQIEFYKAVSVLCFCLCRFHWSLKHSLARPWKSGTG